jgi:hypothetical protein
MVVHSRTTGARNGTALGTAADIRVRILVKCNRQFIGSIGFMGSIGFIGFIRAML